MAFLNYTKPTVPGWHPSLPADIVEPLTAVKTTGHQEKQYPPYEWTNWFWDNLSDWMDYVDDQMDGNEATTKNDTHSTPADATAYADAQAYLSSLPPVINHDINLNLNGTGYAAQTLTIGSHRGVGRILITNAAMGDNIQNIDMQDVKCEVFFSSMTIDGNSLGNGADISDSNQVEFSFCTFQECTNILNMSKNSFVKWTNSTIGASNTNFVRINGNSKLELGDVTQTAALTGYAYDADDGAIVTMKNDSYVYTSSATPMRFYDGAIFSGIYGLNGEGYTSDRTITLTAGLMPYLNSIIETLGKYVPAGRKLTFDLPNYSSTITGNQLKVYGYLGGGSVEFLGNVGATELTGGLVLDIRGNACDILIQDVDITDAGSSSTVSILNNTANVTINTMTLTNGAAGATYGILSQKSNFVYLEGITVPNTNFVRAIEYQYSKGHVSNATLDASAYSLYVIYGSFVGTFSNAYGTGAVVDTWGGLIQ